MGNTYEGEFIVYDSGEHTGVVPKDHKDYRVWVYNKIDCELLSKIVDADTAVKLYDEGWRMTPAAFIEDEALKNNAQFEAMADDMAQLLNFLINIDLCEDLNACTEFAKDFLGIQVKATWQLATLKKHIIKKATKLGLYEDDDSTRIN